VFATLINFVIPAAVEAFPELKPYTDEMYEALKWLAGLVIGGYSLQDAINALVARHITPVAPPAG